MTNYCAKYIATQSLTTTMLSYHSLEHKLGNSFNVEFASKNVKINAKDPKTKELLRQQIDECEFGNYLQEAEGCGMLVGYKKSKWYYNTKTHSFVPEKTNYELECALLRAHVYGKKVSCKIYDENGNLEIVTLQIVTICKKRTIITVPEIVKRFTPFNAQSFGFTVPRWKYTESYNIVNFADCKILEHTYWRATITGKPVTCTIHDFTGEPTDVTMHNTQFGIQITPSMVSICTSIRKLCMPTLDISKLKPELCIEIHNARFLQKHNQRMIDITNEYTKFGDNGVEAITALLHQRPELTPCAVSFVRNLSLSTDQYQKFVDSLPERKICCSLTEEKTKFGLETKQYESWVAYYKRKMIPVSLFSLHMIKYDILDRLMTK